MGPVRVWAIGVARLPIVVALPKLPQLPAAIPLEELSVADWRVRIEEVRPEPESV